MSLGERAASPTGLAGDYPPKGTMRKWELQLNALREAPASICW